MKKINVTLSLKEEDNQISFDEYDNPSITYEGYLHLNKLIGASIFMPDQIYYEGSLKENPYIIRNTDGSIMEVITRAVACCDYNGKIISSNATINFNTHMYYINHLLETVTEDRTAGSIIKRDSAKETDNTLIYHINDRLDLSVNLQNADIIRVISEYTNNKTFAERMAISFAQRNALKKLAPFSSPIKNIVGMKGERTGFVTIEFFYEENSKSLTDLISVAKSINSNINTVDLVNVEGGSIIDVNDIKFFKLNSGVDDTEELQKKEELHRNLLAKRYKSLDPKVVTKAALILFEECDLKLLSNEQLDLTLNYAEELTKNN